MVHLAQNLRLERAKAIGEAHSIKHCIAGAVERPSCNLTSAYGLSLQSTLLFSNCSFCETIPCSTNYFPDVFLMHWPNVFLIKNFLLLKNFVVSMYFLQ